MPKTKTIADMLAEYNDLAEEIRKIGGQARDRKSFRDRKEAVAFVRRAESSLRAWRDGQKKTTSPGLARLRAHPEAENIRQKVLTDQKAALRKEEKVTKAKTKTAPQRGRKAAFDDKAKITVKVKENPKRAKAAERFDTYKKCKTVGAYIAEHGRPQALADLRWDVKQGFITVR